ncbi:MAG TPA: M42 family metallopeptidase [Cyclobacteriaceae bacterium]|nr:M42 family metallopeptidase [Cyclobacteriaceae bacterium]HMV09704.1 M42 family metallopeptidase [Cyclobacteriaceae bacterium]HMV89391.1 M42 family metallopeptidase [Cyclobacteriaceae bacterium]HMX02257.1 M42 family metallopeptidase [Cyclobacteriaceae bacterium]HMX51202.1 M42 family metallopeptidase [Cyclobacteriaceae bacterium]
MDKKSKNFLFEYLNNASPTGFEHSGQQIWLDYLKPYIDDYMVDVYGTAVGVVNPKGQYKVVIEAHADEISWFVNYITEEGYIYVRRNGGSDHQIAPSMRVNLQGDKGIVKGVFGWPAIHVRDAAREETPSLKNIFIDIGAESKKEVEAMGVHVGTVATFEDELIELNKNYLTGRALDNRMGGFMIAEVARRLKEGKKKLPYCLYIVNSVQEEIGLRGAEMISRRLKPDLAICTDVTHDTQSPMYNKKESGNLKCGLGPVVCYGPAVQNNVLKQIIEVANKKKIPFQRQAVSRSTGTDTDSFAYSAEGVASALISLPLKYMHTTVETVHKDDVENVINLIYEVLLQVKPGHDYRYIK